MKIPFVDLKAQYLSIKPEIDSAIAKILDDTAFIGGQPVDEFAQAFADLYGVKHCIPVANGTDAIYITLKMLGIGHGHEVITVANSWISSSETITQAGAKPVFVDIEEDYYTIDPNKIEEKINANTKAIIPVHLYGQPANMELILALAEKHNLFVIEDCAQSHFSEYKGQRCGTMGIAGTFSFYPGKNLGAYGDAGCIITNDDDLAEKCKMYANHGALKKHHHEIEGINSRLDGIQAAVLSTKLPHILNWTEKRINNGKLYNKYITNKNISLPIVRDNCVHTFHLYVIRCNRREELQDYLNTKGIGTAIHYPTILPLLPCYLYLRYSASNFPIAYKYQKEILSIPMYPELSEEMIEYVAGQINNF